VKTRAAVPDGSGTAKALDYTLKRWPALTRYAETGHLPIDNNPVENAIRPVAVGRNYARSEIMLGCFSGRNRRDSKPFGTPGLPGNVRL